MGTEAGNDDGSKDNSMWGNFRTAIQSGTIGRIIIKGGVPLAFLFACLCVVAIVAIKHPQNTDEPPDRRKTDPPTGSIMSATSTPATPAPAVAICPDGDPRAVGSAPEEVSQDDYLYTATIHCPPNDGQNYHLVIEFPKSENPGYKESVFTPQLKDSDSVPDGGPYEHPGQAKDKGSTRHLYVISCTPRDWENWTTGMEPGNTTTKKWPGALVSNTVRVTRK
ncbi:hypothetical protein ACFFQW_38255 [Umezawaea endophytica]|uniref:Uncharacterized protein n=1 Tax=Umezawaea endophytica TaxID=1654476 RepID=A0A9X2VX71_9PSEU|nr:hypothetical protein [Umezawaea endophytica]MCS7483789.1 hypothetical protein [Umezawaea endophytica]